jgi:hypothetical protein
MMVQQRKKKGSYESSWRTYPIIPSRDPVYRVGRDFASGLAAEVGLELPSGVGAKEMPPVAI